jgi:hypothetical protein
MVFERQLLDISLLGAHAPSRRQSDHRLGPVDRGDLDAGPQHRRGERALPTADLEHGPRRETADAIGAEARSGCTTVRSGR